jgi:hypothetical protein
MLRLLGSAAVLVFCAGVLAACGGSGHFTSAEQAAITAIQWKTNVYRIFPDKPSTISCRILAGGPVAGGYFPGHCTTSVSVSAKRIRLDFLERFSPGPSGRASFTVILDKRNRILGEHWHGSPPQLRN